MKERISGIEVTEGKKKPDKSLKENIKSKNTKPQQIWGTLKRLKLTIIKSEEGENSYLKIPEKISSTKS